MVVFLVTPFNGIHNVLVIENMLLFIITTFFGFSQFSSFPFNVCTSNFEHYKAVVFRSVYVTEKTTEKIAKIALANSQNKLWKYLIDGN